MLWNTLSRKPVPICWHRYEPPHWTDWWNRFQALSAYYRADRERLAAQEQQQAQASQTG